MILACQDCGTPVDTKGDIYECEYCKRTTCKRCCHMDDCKLEEGSDA